MLQRVAQLAAMLLAVGQVLGSSSVGAVEDKPDFSPQQIGAAGPNAAGGAHSCASEGKMTGGFALLADPVRYGASGVMTFKVNAQGIVFQKDLGPRTVEIAAKITAYDPDESWGPTE